MEKPFFDYNESALGIRFLSIPDARGAKSVTCLTRDWRFEAKTPMRCGSERASEKGGHAEAGPPSCVMASQRYKRPDSDFGRNENDPERTYETLACRPEGRRYISRLGKKAIGATSGVRATSPLQKYGAWAIEEAKSALARMTTLSRCEMPNAR